MSGKVLCRTVDLNIVNRPKPVGHDVCAQLCHDIG